ncbi:TIR domain-containing protein, partial [Kaarinaea lacus]
ESKFEEAFQQGLMSAAIMLSAAAKELKKGDVGSNSNSENKSTVERIPTPSTLQPAAPEKPAPSAAAPAIAKEPPAIVKRAMAASGNKIFLVYANDIGMKGDVSIFLSKMGVSTIVLKDSADTGFSLIDELEKHNDVHYAIVMLNPDASGISENIVYELGLIVGRLGKNRVCGLVKEYISILANYSGISYVPVDPAGAWKFLLIKQLKEAGFNIDANLAL